MDLLVTAVVGVIAGIGIGILVSGRLDRPNQRTRALEADLEASRAELTSYRHSALAQFRQTAERIHDLDDSYAALRRQLAASAHELCGSELGRRLEEPRSEDRLSAGESSGATDASGETVQRGAIPWSESIADEAADDRAERDIERAVAADHADGDTDRAAVAEDADSDRAAVAEDAADDTQGTASADDTDATSAGSTRDGDRPMTRTEAFRAARAAHAAAGADGKPGGNDAGSDGGAESEDGATSNSRQAAG